MTVVEVRPVGCKRMPRTSTGQPTALATRAFTGFEPACPIGTETVTEKNLNLELKT